MCRFIEKRHGVLAEASIAGVIWRFLQHVSDHMMVQYFYDSGSTNRLLNKCILL